MLVYLLTFIAVLLIGGVSFAGIIEAWGRNPRESAQPSIFINRQFSLGSLVLFLFFPTVSSPPEPLPGRE